MTRVEEVTTLNPGPDHIDTREEGQDRCYWLIYLTREAPRSRRKNGLGHTADMGQYRVLRRRSG